MIARQKLGMSLEEFYACTWYDWGLWTERIIELHHQRKQDHELIIEMFRTSLARYYNWHRGNNPALEPQDFWPLSYDAPRVDRQASPEERADIIKYLEEKGKKLKRG